MTPRRLLVLIVLSPLLLVRFATRAVVAIITLIAWEPAAAIAVHGAALLVSILQLYFVSGLSRLLTATMTITALSGLVGLALQIELLRRRRR